MNNMQDKYSWTKSYCWEFYKDTFSHFEENKTAMEKIKENVYGKNYYPEKYSFYEEVDESWNENVEENHNSFQQTQEGVFKNKATQQLVSREAATLSSVIIYHPVRTVATYIGAGIKISINPKDLYKGFCSGAMGAHQLFMMSIVERSIREKISDEHSSSTTKIFCGALAGMSTTPFITPFEMIMTQRQLKKCAFTMSREISPKVFFRGIIPMCFRQIGLGAGMFSIPGIVQNHIQECCPKFSNEHKKFVAISTTLMAGIFSAVMTHYPEVAKAIMQIDAKSEVYNSSIKAFKEANTAVFTPKWNKILGTRIAVIGICTMVMNTFPDFFQNIVFNKEK